MLMKYTQNSIPLLSEAEALGSGPNDSAFTALTTHWQGCRASRIRGLLENQARDGSSF